MPIAWPLFRIRPYYRPTQFFANWCRLQWLENLCEWVGWDSEETVWWSGWVGSLPMLLGFESGRLGPCSSLTVSGCGVVKVFWSNKAVTSSFLKRLQIDKQFSDSLAGFGKEEGEHVQTTFRRLEICSHYLPVIEWVLAVKFGVLIFTPYAIWTRHVRIVAMSMWCRTTHRCFFLIRNFVGSYIRLYTVRFVNGMQ